MNINRIVVSNSTSDMELLAATILQDYCKQIADSEVNLISQDPPIPESDGTVIIGLPSTNRQIGNLVRSHKIRDPERAIKSEGFLIETLIDGGLSTLVITSHDPKGILNGVYHLLQEIFNVGFFRDGQHVPRLENLTVPELSMAISPRFNIRGELLWGYPGPQRFCSSSWPLNQWRAVIDWQAQKKMNTIEISLPIEIMIPRVFPKANFQWSGPWISEFTCDHFRSILEYGRSRGIRFMYEVWYTKFTNEVREMYPELNWHNEFLCAGQPETFEFSRRLWDSVLEVFGTDHLYTIRYRGEEGQPYSPECKDMPKWQGYVQAYDMLKAVDRDARIAAWSWAEKPEEMWHHFPDDLECQHMKHGLHGEWRFPGLGREVPQGRPPIPKGTPWTNAIFNVFSGTDTKLLGSLSDTSWIIEDAKLSSVDPKCAGFMVWPEWTNTNSYMFDLIAELAWDPASITAKNHITRYSRLRYGGEATPSMVDSLSSVVEAGRSIYTYTPSRRNVSLWFASVDHLTQMKHIRDSITNAWKVFGQLSNSTLYINYLFDAMTQHLHQLAWYFEATAYYHYIEATEDKNTTKLITAGNMALSVWSQLLELYTTSTDYSLYYSARLMVSNGPAQKNFIDTFISQSTEFYYGYPLCASQEEIAYFLMPQCRMLMKELEHAVTFGQPYPGGIPARWYWYNFDPQWKDYTTGMPFPDLEIFRSELRSALGLGLALIEPSSESTVQVLTKLIRNLPELDGLPTISNRRGTISLDWPIV